MVNVGQYLADAGGQTRDVPLRTDGSAGADPGRTSPPTGRTRPGRSSTTRAAPNAAEAGVDALGNAIDNVDFPGFVAGLIDGVFNAIVDARRSSRWRPSPSW